MSNTVLNYPGQVKVTTNTELSVRRLPLGVRSPLTYTLTAVTPVGSAANITLGADAAIGATTLTVGATGAAYASGTILTLGSAAVVLSAAAASGATSLTIFPLNFSLSSGTVLTYNPGALSLGSTLLPVSALPTTIDVGTRLAFGAQTVIVSGRSPQGATQLRVSPLTAIIAPNTTATTEALFAVVGCTSFPVPSPEPKVIETTTLLSGIGKEQAITGVSQTMTVSFEQIAGDLGGDEILSILRDNSQYNRELYFRVRMPDGERHEGVAIVTAGPESGELQDKRMVQATFQVQGATYVYVPSTFRFF
jgi:hypothetical protein